LPAAGERIDRYLVLRDLGAGPEGAVFAAYDTELARQVVLKLIDAGGEGAERLIGEAQAMARVKHPDVVAIFDVGRSGDQVFVTMELVDGETLAEWLARGQPSAEAVLQKFRAAGRGLAAAHAAGISHRGFDAGHVMVDRTGRARVMDFGLAALEPDATEEAHPSDDQRRFCIALDEALARVRRVPRRISEAVARGRDEDRERRWPDMESLLAALQPEPPRRWPLWAGLLLVALAAVGGILLRRDGRALCAGAERELGGVWDPSRRETVRRAFAGADSFARVAALLDRYAGDWAKARTEACRATRVDGVQSEELLDLRMQCLDDRRGQLGATVEVLGGAHVDDAVQAAAALPPLESCADAKSLLERVPPPRDPRQRQTQEALRARLHRVTARFDAGQFADVLPEAQALVADATRAGYLPLVAEARMRLAEVLEKLQRLNEAAREFNGGALDAERGRDDRVAAIAWCNLAFIQAVELSNPDEGMRLIHLARAKLDRIGPTERDEQLWQHDASVIEHVAGHLEEAIAAGQKALAMARKIEPDGTTALDALENLGNIYAQQGQENEALPLLREAAEGFEKKLGLDHLLTFYALLNVGTTLLDVHQPKEALAIFDRALGVAERIHAPAVDVGMVHAHRGGTLAMLHRIDEALEEDRRAVAIISKAAPPGHNSILDSLSSYGFDLLDAGDPTAAVKPLEQALSLMETKKVRPIDAADVRFGLARAVWATGAHARARSLAATSLAVFTDAAQRLGGQAIEQRDEVAAWLAKHR
jgi:tetratricopeptide (TPR) repeat protein/tRNA A-37 threonylcarbamoyl transferase component Bud32